MHEIFDELEEPARPANPGLSHQRRLGWKVSGGAGAALLLTATVTIGAVLLTGAPGQRTESTPSPSLAVAQGTVEGGGESTTDSPSPAGDGLTLGTNPNAVEARPSARASVVPIEAPVRQNPDRSDPEAVMKAWAVTWSWREKPQESARVAEWVEPFSNVHVTDAFATAEPVVGVQAPFMVTKAEVLPRSKSQGIDTDFRKSRVVRVTVRDHRNVQVVLTYELTTLQDEAGQWMVTDVAMTSWEGVKE